MKIVNKCLYIDCRDHPANLPVGFRPFMVCVIIIIFMLFWITECFYRYYCASMISCVEVTNFMHCLSITYSASEGIFYILVRHTWQPNNRIWMFTRISITSLDDDATCLPTALHYCYVILTSLTIGHVNEYPTMHYFGNPRPTQSMIAYIVFLEIPEKSCIVGMLLTCPVVNHVLSA